MVGFVIVSHSKNLAESVVELTTMMAPTASIKAAGGMEDGGFGTSFEKIKDAIELPKADIVFAPHHGRKSGKIPKEWMDSIAPQMVVIGEAPSGELNYLSDYNTITQNSAKDIIFDCDSGFVDVYVSNENYSVDFLDDKKKPDKYGATYIGTLNL